MHLGHGAGAIRGASARGAAAGGARQGARLAPARGQARVAHLTTRVCAVARSGQPAASAARSTTRRLALSSEPEDLGDRQREDPQVQPQRPVLDVVVVPLDAVGDRGLAAQAVDLGPAGDPGLDAVAVLVAGDVARELAHVLGALGPRADEAHVAAQHVEQLGQLVERESRAGSARRRGAVDPPPSTPPGADAAARRHRCGSRAQPASASPARRISAHRPELEHVELAAVAADPALAEEDRARRGDADGERDAPASPGEQQTARATRESRDRSACLIANCQPRGSTGCSVSSGRPPTWSSVVRSLIDSYSRGTSETSTPSASHSLTLSTSTWSGSEEKARITCRAPVRSIAVGQVVRGRRGPGQRRGRAARASAAGRRRGSRPAAGRSAARRAAA